MIDHIHKGEFRQKCAIRLFFSYPESLIRELKFIKNMEDIKQLFGKLVERETKDNVGAVESMREVWKIIKDKPDPFSVAIRNVIIERVTEIRRVASSTLRFHREVFSNHRLSDETLDDRLIDFLAAQEKQVKIAEEILRDDLGVSTES